MEFRLVLAFSTVGAEQFAIEGTLRLALVASRRCCMFTILAGPGLAISIRCTAIACIRRVAILVERLEACTTVETMRVATFDADDFTIFPEPPPRTVTVLEILIMCLPE